MSKTTTKTETVRTVETVEKEIADLTAERREIGRRIRSLRAEKDALIEAARVAAEVDLAARFRAAAGDPEALEALVAEVAAATEDGAAPEDDPDDGYHG
ncbi:hypothetical protein [Corynebacterium xerosis]|uniref:DUF4315 family protein n=1 Tax=Corynebacterium xerosis TaxID=1725 RepID=A0ABV3UUR7_9CORY